MRQSNRAGRIGIPLLGLFLAAAVSAGFTGGCTQVRQAEHSVGVGGGVPKNAERLTTGVGNQAIVTTSPSEGTVFVNDEDTAVVVYSGRVRAGEQIVVDGPDNTISVGQFKKDVKINRHDKYAVYLQSR